MLSHSDAWTTSSSRWFLKGMRISFSINAIRPRDIRVNLRITSLGTIGRPVTKEIPLLPMVYQKKLKSFIFPKLLQVSWKIAEEDHQEHQSTLVTQLIHYNESETCDVVTNVIFLLLVLLILGCLVFVIALCVNPEFFGIVPITMPKTPVTHAKSQVWDFCAQKSGIFFLQLWKPHVVL